MEKLLGENVCTSNTVHTDKHLSDAFPVHSGLKHGMIYPHSFSILLYSYSNSL